MGAYSRIDIDTEASRMLQVVVQVSNERDDALAENERLRAELAASQAWAAQLLSGLLIRALNEGSNV